MSPPQINELSKRRNKSLYNLRPNAEFLQPFVNSVHRETESTSHVDPRIWDMAPGKNTNTLYNFKRILKKWKPENWPSEFVKVLSKL